MKRFTIVRKQDDKSTNAAKRIQEALLQHHFVEDETNPELVITVGGDGTLLFAVHKYLSILDTVQFVAVHTGTLGFYTDYNEDTLQECIEDILKGEVYELFTSPLLEIAIHGDKVETLYALNEVRIENVVKTQVLDIYIDGEFFEKFKGNGMCLSTQAGATAYNRSLGGAVVDSGLRVLQLSEIAGIHDSKHNSLGNPYIMKDDRKITFACDEFNDAYLCYDHLYKSMDNAKSITCRLSDKVVTFARYKKYSYLKRLRNLY